MLSDLRFAFRQLMKAPGFTAIIVLTLALGIGACVIIFALVNSVLLYRFGPDSGRRVVIVQSLPPSAAFMRIYPIDWLAWEAELKSFELLMAHNAAPTTSGLTLTGEGEPLLVGARWVTNRFFAFHGTKFLLGREFLPAEHSPEKGSVVVFSHGFWQRVFGGRKDILGRMVVLDGSPHTVVGVTAERQFPVGENSDLYLPSGIVAGSDVARGPLNVRGLLKPGVTLAQAQAEIDVVTARLAEQHPDIHQGRETRVMPMHEYLTHDLRPVLLTLFAAALCVLLIGCANISSLLLLRATIRQREFALRAALGASRSRLVRQLFIESVLLALLAGTAGILIAQWTAPALRAFASIRGMETASFEIGAGLILFAIGLSLASAFLFGLVPALLSSRVDLNESLKQGMRGSTESRARGRLRHALVVLEVASATVLLAAAGLFLRSFIQIAQVDPGLVPKNALAMGVALPREKYARPEQRLAFVDALLTRIAALPGVQAAGVTQFIPFASTAVNTANFQIEGRTLEDPASRPRTRNSVVSRDYFPAAGVRLIRGRYFSEHDLPGRPRVALINETFARQHFPGEDPIGHRILAPYGSRNAARDDWLEIVGVVADVTQASPEQPVTAQLYRNFSQQPASSFSVIVRTAGDPAALGQSLKAQVYAVDPMQPVAAIRPLQEIIDDRVSEKRFQLQLLTTFSLLALTIAVVGIYGVIAYSVSQRTAEIGIRMALGAQSSDVARLVLSQGARLVGLGLLIGVAGALVTGRMIQARLFQVSAHDPLTLIAITVLIAGAGLLACVVPVRRATKVDPIVALRAE